MSDESRVLRNIVQNIQDAAAINLQASLRMERMIERMEYAMRCKKVTSAKKIIHFDMNKMNWN